MQLPPKVILEFPSLFTVNIGGAVVCSVVRCMAPGVTPNGFSSQISHLVAV